MANFGRNVRFDSAETLQTLCVRAYDLAIAEGKLAPQTDKLNFLRKARAHVSMGVPDSSGVAAIVDVMITWEE